MNVIIVVAQDRIVNAKARSTGNYVGYRSCLFDDGNIYEEIGYGFGGWHETAYDDHLCEISHKDAHDYGRCCDLS